MGLVDTEALVLRTYNLAEADKIVVCLTKVSRPCCEESQKDVENLRNRFGASLEPFTSYTPHVLREGKSRNLFRSARPKS